MKKKFSPCIFCQIVAGTLPCYEIYQDEYFLAFLDIYPVSDGHILIIPKKHYDHVWDVPNLGAMMEVARTLALHLKKKLGLEFVDACVFGRGVNHAHVRLHPYSGAWRTFCEELGEKTIGAQAMLASEKAQKLVELLRFSR